MGKTITGLTARSATWAGAVALCCAFQVAHGQPLPVSSPSLTCISHGSFEAQVLQTQSMDIGSRGATLAMTRHRMLAELLIPERQTRVPCSGPYFLRDASSMRRSHPVHGGNPPSDPPAKTADSRESFPYLE